MEATMGWLVMKYNLAGKAFSKQPPQKSSWSADWYWLAERQLPLGDASRWPRGGEVSPVVGPDVGDAGCCGESSVLPPPSEQHSSPTSSTSHFFDP